MWASTLAAIAADLRKSGVEPEHAWECAAAQLRGDPPPDPPVAASPPEVTSHRLADMARANGVRPATAWARVRAGWSVADAVRAGEGRGRWRDPKQPNRQESP